MPARKLSGPFPVSQLKLFWLQVWDYASDGYVHRLVQSKTDGKLVEVPSPAQAAHGERQSVPCAEYVLCFLGHYCMSALHMQAAISQQICTCCRRCLIV